MANKDELRFEITADGKKAKAEIKNVDAAIDKLAGGSAVKLQKGFKGITSEVSNLVAIFTGNRLSGITSQFTSLGNAVAAIPGPAGLAAGALAGIAVTGAAALTAVVALAKSASDYGSVIHDIGEKTGLSAETISTLKFAADQSGSSIEQFSTGLRRFTLLMGEAAGGSDKAKASLAALHVTSTDLNTGLGQALKTIAELPPGIAQNTAAATAFGKKLGAELIPTINSFRGDLPGLQQELEKLGLVMSQANADAADKFGDTLGKLESQAGALGRQFATELMPAMTGAMQQISQIMAENKGVVSDWGQSVILVTQGVGVAFGYLEKAVELAFFSFARELGGNTKAIDQWATQALLSMNPVIAAWNALRQLGVESGAPVGMDVSKPLPPSRTFSIPTIAKAPKALKGPRDNSERDAERARKEAEREAEAAERKRVADARQLFHDETSFFEAEAAKRYAIAAEYADREGKTENDLARFKEFLESEVLRVKKEKLEEYIKELVAGTDEYKRAEQELRVLEQAIETDRAEHAVNQQERDKKTLEDEKKIHDERRKHWKEYMDFIHEQDDAADAEADRRANEEAAARRKSAESGSVLGGGGLGAGIARGLGVTLPSIWDDTTNQIKSQAQILKDVYADVADFAGQAIGSMIDGLVQMGIAWLMTGEFSAQAALKMLASTAFSIATQAGMKAIFEYAEGLAALGTTWGVPNPSSIAHFAAAATYGTIAAIAGGAGVGLALGARAAGGGNAGGRGANAGGSAGSSTVGQVNQNPTPYSRVSENAYISGRRNQDQMVAAAINKLTDKIGCMSPGDVLVRGTQQKRGHIIETAIKEVRGNAGHGRNLGRSMGIG